MIHRELSAKDRRICIIFGNTLAQRCLNGSEGSEIKLDKLAGCLSGDVLDKFKIEIIYCRIFIAFHILKIELSIQNFRYKEFEISWNAFQNWFKKNWQEWFEYRVTYRIVEYSKIFLPNGVYEGLKIDDSIVDYLLIKVGFTDEELFFDSADLKKFFVEECTSCKNFADDVVFWLSLDSEIRDETFKQLNIKFLN